MVSKENNVKNSKVFDLHSNIIKWYDFKEKGKALVIGDRIGSITLFLSVRMKEVISIINDNENNPITTSEEINKKRNIKVINDDFCNMNFSSKFDYIIIIDTISYTKEENENIKIINKAKDLLNKNGVLFLAIDNVMSLKNISEGNEIKGVSKEILERILKNSNVIDYKFYYPLPNNKNANVIFSDELLPTSIDLERNMDLKYSVQNKKFDDRRFLAEITKRNKSDFVKYCNSFLVKIGNDSKKKDAKAIYYNNIRRNEYKLITKIFDDRVEKICIDKLSKKHLFNIKKNIKILKDVGIETLDCFDKKIISKYVKNGRTLQDDFLMSFREKNFIELRNLISKYKNEMLLKLGVATEKENVFCKYKIEISDDKINKMTFVKNGLYDLIFSNIFIIEDKFYVYDQEWIENNFPIEMILWRSIRYMPKILNEEKSELYKMFNIDEFIDEFNELEGKIQEKILDKDLHTMCLNDFKSYDKIGNNQEIENIKKELVFKQNIIDSKGMVNAYLNNQVHDFSTAYNEVSEEIERLRKELELKNQEVTNIYNSKQYQKGMALLKVEKSFFPLIKVGNLIKKVIKPVLRIFKRAVLKCVRKVGKIAYKVYPIKNHKRKLKNKILYSRKLAKIANVKTKEEYCYDQNIDNILFEDGAQERCVKFQTELNKTIGIHLHLYYTDLADEFCDYFSNIPYVFDLYVSVMKGTNVKNIERKFKKILNLNKVKVVETPNSGRDFGAMFVEFRNELKNYDYVMHVHSKKSLRMGNDQSEWRRFMLDHLLGSPERIMKSFYLMETMGMGMVYVDCFKGPYPYWINTWLGEAPLAKQILNRMDMNFEDEVLQFPAGSMFWAKSDALKQLFDLNLTWDDFGYETGEEDNSLAYVFERITGKVARHNNYDLAIFNVYENRYRVNRGEQLLSDYYKQNKDSLFNILNSYDIVTFDIFDTLITRHVYNPDDSFEIIENRIKEKGIKIEKYFQLRKEAEFNVRKNKDFVGDCSIHEIYQEFEKLTGFSHFEVEVIKQIEIDTEYELVIPRREMLELYNNLLKVGKKIILISDMYLTKDIIARMLNKCGYYNWFDLLVSSEVGARKDNGTMWKYFFEKYENCTTNHVGDNEYSDVHALMKIGKQSFHVMKGKKLASLMDGRYVENDEKLNLLESVMIGTIINNVVSNSPFVMNRNSECSYIDNYYKYGYSVLGPIVFKYMLWLIKMAKETKNGEVFLFAAREGHYLQKIFNIFKEKLGNLDKIEDHYLYISRRAVTVMGIETIEDVRKIMETVYSGSLREVLYYRLNYKEDNFKDEIITLPRDIDKVMRIVEENFDIILNNAKKEKESYLKYIDSLNIDFENKKVSMLDLGYAGTAQYYLAKLLNKKIDGKYFVVQSRLKPTQLGCDVYSCFNKNIYNQNIDNNVIFRSSLLLEAFFTAPDGQFLYMDIENNEFIPRFQYEPDKTEQIEILDKVYEGVKEYIETVLNFMGESVFEYDIDNKFIYRCYENCLSESTKFNDDLKKMFSIEDFYCQNGVVNGFEVLNRRKKEWTRD